MLELKPGKPTRSFAILLKAVAAYPDDELRAGILTLADKVIERMNGSATAC